MADEGGLRTDLLADFGDKLDQIYVKLGQLDDQLQKFENREVKIELSKDSRATARALDELARAFVRFSNADTAALKTAGVNVSTFVTDVNESMGKIDKSNTGIIAEVFKPFLLDLTDVIVVASGLSPAKLRGVKDVLGESKEIFIVLKDTMDSVSGVSDAGVRLIKKITKDVITPLFQAVSRLLSESDSITPARIDALGKLLEPIGSIFERVSYITTSVGRLTSSSGPGAVVKLIALLRIGIIPLLKITVGFLDVLGNISPQRLNAAPTSLIGMSLVFTAISNFIGGLLLVTQKGSTGVFIKTILLLQKGVLPVLRFASSLLVVMTELKPQKLVQIPVIFSALVNVFTSIALFVTTITSLAKNISLSEFAKVTLLFGSLESILKPIAKLVDLRGIKPEAIAAIPQIFAQISFLLDSFLDLQNHFKGLSGIPKFILSMVGFSTIIEIIGQSVRRIINATRGTDPRAIEGLGPILTGIKDIVDKFIEISDKFSSFGGFFKLLYTAFISFGVVVGAVANAVKKVVQATSGADPKGLEGLGLILTGLTGVIRQFIELEKSFTGNFVQQLVSLIRSLIIFNVVTSAIAGSVKKLAKAVSGTSPGQLEGTAALLSAFRLSIHEFIVLQQQFSGGFGSINDIIRLAQSIITFNIVSSAIAKAAKSLVKALSSATPQQLEAGSGFVRAFKDVMQDFISLQQSISGESIIAFFGRLIKVSLLLNTLSGGLTKAVGGIAKIAKKAKPGDIADATQAIKAIVELSQQNLEEDSSKNFAKIMKEIGESLKSFDINKKSLKSLEVLGKSLKSLVDSGEGTKALAAILDVLSRPEAQNIKDISFGNLAKELEKLVKVLKNLSSEELTALSASLSGNGSTSLNSSMEQTGKETKILGGRFQDLSDEISEGILEGTLELRIFDTALGVVKGSVDLVIRAFQLFNPVSLFISAANAAAQLGDKVKEIGTNIREMGENLRDFGTNLIDNFGVGALTGSEAFGTAVDFDRISTQLQVFGGLSDEALVRAQAFSNQIGIDYPLSANDALAATLDLVKAGQTLDEIEFTLPAAADLAALSDSGDLNLTTNALIAAANGFQVFSDASGEALGGFENIDLAANIISGAADISTASIESLSEGLANVGPAANAFGLSLEETSAVLAIFDQNAISGAEGGTALRSLLNALGSDKSLQTLQNLGIALFDPETGGRRPLNDVINDIGAALNDLPDAQRASVLQGLADTYGRQGLSILLNAGADAIDNTVTAINGVAPASERAAAMLDNFAGDVEQLKGSMETLLVRVLLPTLERFFRPFVKIARFVVDGFLGLSDSVLTFVGSMISLASIGATIIGGMAVLAGVVLQVGGAFFIVLGTLINFGAVLAGVAVGITGFVAGLAVILATVTAVLPLILGVTAIFETLFKIFKEDAGGAATAARNFFGAIAGVGSSVISFLSSLFGLISANARFFSRDGGGLTTFGESIAAFFNGLTDSLNNSAIGRIRDNLSQVSQVFNTFAQIRGLFSRRRENADIQSDLIGLNGVSSGLAAVNDQIDAQITNLINNLFLQNSLFRNAVQRFFGESGLQALDSAKDFIDVFDEFFINIAQRFDEVVQVFQNFVGSILDGVSFGDAFATLVTDFDAAAGDFVRSIIDFMALLFGPTRFVQQLQFLFRGDLSDSVGRIIPFIIDRIRESIISHRNTLKNIIQTIFSIFFAPIKSLRFFADILGIDPLVRLIDFFEGILKRLVGGLFDTVINLLEGQSISEALINAFGEGITPLVRFGEAIFNAVTTIVSAIGNLFGSLSAPPGNPVGGFLDFINDQLNLLTNIINGFTNLILKPLAEGDIGQALTNIGGLIVTGLSAVLEFVKAGILGLGLDFSNIGTLILGNIISSIVAAFTTVSEITGINFDGVIAALQTTLNAALETVDDGPEGAFAAVANTLLGLLVATVVAVFNGITDLTGVDFTGAVDGLLSALSTTLDANVAAADAGGVGGVFSVVANTIVGALAAAVSAALLTVGDLLNLNPDAVIASIEDGLGGVFDSIQNLFQDTEEGDSIFTNIKQTIDNIVLAFTTLFDFFTNNAAPDTSGIGGALQPILDFIGRLVDFGLDLISSLFKAIDDFFEGLSNLDAAQLTTLAVAITAGAVAFFLMSGGATSLAVSAAALTTSLIPMVTALAGVIAVLLVIKAVANNFDELFEAIDRFSSGDIGGGLRETFDALLGIFTDIAFSIANVLGFDTIFGSTEEDILAAGRSIGNQLLTIFDLIGQNIADFVAVGIANLQLLAAHAKAAAQGVFDDSNENFDAVNTFFQETRDFSLDSLGQIKNAEVDAGVVANFALVNQDEISRQVRDEITANIAEGVNGIDADQVQTLIDVGALDRVLQDAIAGGDIDIVSAIFASGNANISPEQIQTSIDQILAAIEAGTIDREQGINLLHFLGFDTTTLEPVEVDVPVEPEVVSTKTPEEIRAEADAARIAAQQAAEEETPVPVQQEVPVEVEPTPTQTPEEIADDVQQEVENQITAAQEQVAEAQQEIQTELGVTTTTTTLGLENVAPETVPQLSADVLALQTNLGLLRTDIDAIIPVLQTTVTEFTTFNDTLVIIDTELLLANTNVTTLTISITQLGLMAAFHLNLILIPALQSIIDKTASFGTTVTANINLASSAMKIFAITAQGAFGAIATGTASAISNVQKLTKALTDADAAARSVDSAIQGATGTGSSADNQDGPRAHGGTTLEGGLYRVTEGGSEVLQENGKQYLLSGGRGRVSTLEQALPDISNARRTGVIPAPTSQNTTVTTTSNINATIEGSTIALTVNGSNMSAAELRREILPAVQRELDVRDRKVKAILRTNAR